MVAVGEVARRPPSVLPHPWTSAWGEDEFGIWMEFEFRGVVQRLRWIGPDDFLMGSPQDEPERSGDELQHEVVLTQGFWLADTACTQALWEAVMGENPSGFKGADRPVDWVSWEDCQRFIKRINEEIPGLALRLPSEAQWEYACRAGTTTPFSFGNNVGTEQVNYHGGFPYADGPKGEYRGQTVVVKSLPANGWGLYEMHGNVLEWCADWYGLYEEGRIVDPQGAEQGDRRVLRGGSWVLNGRNCRSAARYFNEPGYRIDFAGLRLLRGQEGQEQAKGQG